MSAQSARSAPSGPPAPGLRRGDARSEAESPPKPASTRKRAASQGEQGEQGADGVALSVRNIPFTASSGEFSAFLDAAGVAVTKLTLHTRKKNPALHVGSATVVVADGASADALLSRDGADFMGRAIRVGRPKAPAKKTAPEKKTRSDAPPPPAVVAGVFVITVAGGRRVSVAVGAVDGAVVDASKDEIRELPLYGTAAEVRCFRTAGDVCEGVALLRRSLARGGGDVATADGGVARVLGFDTETKPTFRKGEAQKAVALVQLATRDLVCLFLLYKCDASGLPGPLMDLLGDADVLKVGVGCSGDEKALRKRCPAFDARGTFVDLERLAKAKFPNLRACGLRGLVGSLGRQRLSKGQQCANWEAPHYTPAMVKYAANDAAAGLFCLDAILAK